MEKQIYAYALIKSQYDNKGDFLDSFYPFILSAFPRKMDLVKLNDIQKELKLKPLEQAKKRPNYESLF